MNSRPPRRRATVRIAYGAAALLAVMLILVALAPQVIRGPRFGQVAGWMMPKVRGVIAIGGGRWSWGAAWSLWRGRPATLMLENVRVTDPEGTEVLRVAQATGAIELARDGSRLVIHDLHLAGAAWRFAQMKGGRDVGFLAAFQPVHRVAARRPARPSRLAVFAIAAARLDGLDARFDFPAWGLTLTDVHARGDLAVATPPATPPDGAPATPATPVFTFAVSDADLRGGGLLRVLAGTARTELPFSSGTITRVATTAAAPDALQLEASAVATGRSRLSLVASFGGIYAARPSKARSPSPGQAGGGIDLRARFTDAADAAQAIIQRRSPAPPLIVEGRDATLTVTFRGAFDQLVIEAGARGFDLRHGDLQFLGAGFDLSLQLPAGRAHLAGLTFASPAGGRLTLDADIDQRRVAGALTVAHFATTPYMPVFLRPLAGGVLDGRLQAEFDLAARSAAIAQLALTLDRPRGAWGPRKLSLQSQAGGSASRDGGRLRILGARFANGTLVVPEVALPVAGGQVKARASVVLTDAAGKLRPPIVDLTAVARGISVARLAGSTFASGELSFRAHAHGTVDDLVVDVDVPPGESLRVFGEPCRLPASTTLRVTDYVVTLDDFRLRGAHGAELALGGRIDRTGQLALALDVRDFPLDRLPALSEADLPFAGRISGRLAVSGTTRAPLMRGRVAMDGATFQGRPLGGGALTITPRPGGAIHGEGQVIEGVIFEGTLTPLINGLRGHATLGLRDVRLDPFLAAAAPLLPAGTRATGKVSGLIEAHVAPGQPPSADARLSALALTVTAARQAIDLHAVGDVHVSARAVGGPVRLDPARFVGDAGSIELQGEAENGRMHAAAQGRLALGRLAPLAQPWASRVAGDVDFEIDAAVARADAPPVVTGTIRVANPVSLRLAALPFDVRLASGLIRLLGDGTTHLDLPMMLGAGTLRLAGTIRSPILTSPIFTSPTLTSPTRGAPRLALNLGGDLDAQLLALAAPGAIARARGRARLDADIQGTLAHPTVRARLQPGGVTVVLRALPEDAIDITGGQIDLDDQTLVMRALTVAVGGKARLTIGAQGDGAATVGLGALMHPWPQRLALPVRGRVTATAVPPAVIDDASFALRLDGDLSRRARLSGDITLVKVHLPSTRRKKETGAPPSGHAPTPASPTASPWRSRPELARVELDVHAHSHGGAVTVELANVPDVRVDVDYHLGGTAGHPQATGRIAGADVYSAFALFMGRILGLVRLPH